MVACVQAYPPSELSLIPSGAAGIRATLDKMVGLVREYRKNATINQLATELTRHLPSKDYAGEVRALWEFVRKYIRYMQDIRGVETLRTPLRLLQNRAGDCDDQATLLATLLETTGKKTRFVAMGFQPDLFSHVLCEVRIGDRWIPLETTVDRPFGWNPPNQVKRMVVPV